MLSRKPHPLVKLLAIYLTALVLLAVFAAMSGCGPSARDKALQATLFTVNSTRDGFLAADDEIQGAIVKACTPQTGCTEEKGIAQLDAYVVKRAPIVDAFELAYRALALAAINDKTPLADMLAAAAALKAAYATFQSSTASQSPTSP